MLSLLSITGPIFLIIGVGYLATRLGTLDGAPPKALGQFVIQFALPALLFRSIAHRPPEQLLPWDFLARYTAGSLLVILVGLVLIYGLRRKTFRLASVEVMGMTLSNSAFMGFPIAEQIIGLEQATDLLGVYVFVENLVMVPILITLAEASGHGQRHPLKMVGSILLRLIKNPLILSMLLGFGFSWFKVPIPAAMVRVIDLLAGASAPVALFYIGCILAGLKLRNLGADLFSIAAGKLILHPLMVALIFVLWPIGQTTLTESAILNAAMPMATIYPLLGQKYGQEGLCAASLMATTVLAFITVTSLIGLFRIVACC
jgi:predicted permease